MIKSKKKIIESFFKSEIAIGLSLLFSTILALFFSNSNNSQIYQDFFSQKFPLEINFINIHQDLNLRDWINDALMSIFFLLVGLELKKEILVGELSSKSKLSLPLIAAFGGVIVPILIFYFFNHSSAQNIRGFAIPCATDIAFAYGAISIFSKTFSNSAKVFLVALAVIDDLIAILIIAIFYSKSFDFLYAGFALLLISCLAILNILNSKRLPIYFLIGVFLWLMILKSGLHSTLAGVILAMFIPLKIGNKNLIADLAHKIAPSVNFLILPIFAFANAGVRIDNFSISYLSQNLVLGIIFALFFGKQIGVVLFSFLAVKLKIAHLPRGTNRLEFYVVSLFTGIGFTMSLFIASLAFYDNKLAFDQSKIAILIGSFLSLLFGCLFAVLIQRKRRLAK